MQLASQDGRVGLLIGQSFMFLSSYESLRALLRSTAAIEVLAQFDYHLFRDARMDTVALTLRKERRTEAREAARPVCFRLVHPTSSDGKRRAFEEALAALQQRAGRR